MISTAPTIKELRRLLASGAIPSEEAILAEIERRRQQRLADEARQQADEIRERCKTLHGFVREAWRVLEPTAEFVDNWHIEAVCEHLQAISRGQLHPRLLINIWPGSMKSLLASVMWQAWEWGPEKKTSTRWLATAFNETPVKRDSRRTRDLIASPWYQELWPHVRLTRTGEISFANSETGNREGVPFISLTSQRGDRVIIDDPHSVLKAESDAERETTTRKFREGALNRLNDQRRSAMVVIMQRLHTEDISGVILSKKFNFVHLCLPLEFEPDRRCVTPIFSDPREREGEIADPVRFPREVVEELKDGLGPYAYNGQYQQRPGSRQGVLFMRHYFKTVPAAPPEATRKVRSWDLAATIPELGKDPDWTAGLKMSTDGRRYFIEDVQRMRMKSADVRQAIRNMATLDTRRCHIRIPQDPGQAGKDQAESIVAELAGWRVTADRETGDKVVRAEPFLAQCEAGNVYLVEGPWVETFLDELCAFPGGKFDDQVDAASGAFNALAKIRSGLQFTNEQVAALSKN